MLVIPNTKFLQLQKMVRGLSLAADEKGWMRVNSNGLFIETTSSINKTFSSLQIQPGWFHTFNPDVFSTITRDNSSIAFYIGDFRIIVDRADPNECLVLQLKIGYLNRKPVLNFEYYKTNQENKSVRVRRDQMALHAAQNPLLDIELDERWSINPDYISYVEMDGASSFLDAIQYAAEYDIRHVQLEIKDRWVRPTVPGTRYLPVFLFNELKCTIRNVPPGRKFICDYDVRSFSPRYLRSVSPTGGNNHEVRISSIKVSIAENLPFTLDLNFDKWTRFRLRLPTCKVVIQEGW